MTSPAEFKEKTFEKYFGYELARLTNVTFSPDQCDERFIGFDDAFLLPWHFLRHHLPYRRSKRWSRLSGVSLKEIDFHAHEISKRLPKFKFNLFVQYKRPTYVDHFNGKEWNSWGGPYFRFDVTPHQQRILANMETQSHGRASVIYASAAFWTNDDLYEFCSSEKILENTNISNVALLVGHGRFTYDKPGCNGIGHSEPEALQSKPIQQIIAGGQDQQALPFAEHIKRSAVAIERSLEGDDQTSSRLEQVRRARFSDLFDEIEGPKSDSFIYALGTLEAFSEAFDLAFYSMA